MISPLAAALLRQLAAEGVAGWLAEDAAVPFSQARLRRLTAKGTFSGLLSAAASADSVRDACDALLRLYEAGDGDDGFVSAAVDRDICRAVDRPNLLLRITPDEPGLRAATATVAAGYGIDIAPVCSLDDCVDAMDAYFTGLDLALAAGLPLERLTAVISVPVGQLDAEVDARLDRLASKEALDHRGTAALAVARLAFRIREEKLGEEWWRVLRAAGARPPRLLWTTPRPHQLTALVGWRTGQALSAEVLEEAVAHGAPRGDTLLKRDAAGRAALAGLDEVGIDMTEVSHALGAARGGAGRPARS
ncbi:MULTISPECIES: hypothetical protein [unclassified Streptomyces]|uniref:hypothetical protein n=1 Tax=unclassified Streptomyces TaxID=2593676 RepID=UPI0020332199|nr:hypothetical protein [Streptomyces sp. RKAG290]MCM2413792.1 hypothetical protein [Streptomyces sp. RKAG290]